MKHRTKNMLRAMAKHLRLKVKHVDYLGEDIQGVLLPNEGRILINAHKPRCEHVFTLLHEFGHFLLHFKNPTRKHHPRILDIHWKTEFLARACSKLRRYFRYIFNKKSGKEWDADLWAMCAFIYFAKHTGGRDMLCRFLERHPDKIRLFLLAGISATYSDIKTRIKKFGRVLMLPLQASW